MKRLYFLRNPAANGCVPRSRAVIPAPGAGCCATSGGNESTRSKNPTYNPTLIRGRIPVEKLLTRKPRTVDKPAKRIEPAARVMPKLTSCPALINWNVMDVTSGCRVYMSARMPTYRMAATSSPASSRNSPPSSKRLRMENRLITNLSDSRGSLSSSIPVRGCSRMANMLLMAMTHPICWLEK